eukprot:scaffold244_cov126-Skeletonema_dohrnii-CCMP3373.AAC.4
MSSTNLDLTYPSTGVSVTHVFRLGVQFTPAGPSTGVSSRTDATQPGGRETPVEPVKSTRAKQGGANYDFKRKNLFSIQSKAKASANRRFPQTGVSLPPGQPTSNNSRQGTMTYDRAMTH